MSIESLGAPLGAGETVRQQCASAVLMIRPSAFDYNPQTAATNAFQKATDGTTVSASQRQALAEFDGFVNALQSEGISVCVADDAPVPPKPDAIFPNNWISFHQDGTVVLYPMHAPSRRLERRPEIVDAVVRQLGFKVSRVVDLTRYEAQGKYLEGTGSLVLDHVARVAYACKSPRTDADVLQEWARELGYEPVLFEAMDRSGVPYYHTNVLMCIGARVAVIGATGIAEKDRDHVIARLQASGRDLIRIADEEIAGFAGNMLELASWDEALGDCHVLVMSATARHALRPESYARITANTDTVLAAPVPTIERLGGGGVRCMMAEVFLAR